MSYTYLMTTATKWKLGAIGAALLPIGFFLLFAIGEGGGGIEHYMEVATIAAFLAIGWYKPRIAGITLLTLGTICAILYFFFFSQRLPLWVVGLVEMIVVAPILVCGYMLFQASQK